MKSWQVLAFLGVFSLGSRRVLLLQHLGYAASRVTDRRVDGNHDVHRRLVGPGRHSTTPQRRGQGLKVDGP